MLKIDKAFNPETLNVHGFYQKPGVGLYIPLYQREYSWDKDNIDQLLDDIVQGVSSIAENKEEIRFLGTVIAVPVKDKRNIYPIDPQGLPSLIENIIDGQQRLSTIALFATLLYKHVWTLQRKVPNSTEELIKSQIDEACEYWKGKLIDVFSLDLHRGKPRRKPKIIRGNTDQWTKDGDSNDNYKSDVANYLAQFIDYISDEVEEITEMPAFNKKTKSGRNLDRIDKWLSNTVVKAHEYSNTDDFIPAWEILEEIDEEYIWQYSRSELKSIVNEKEKENKRSIEYTTCALTQLFAVAHYLLERCCFTMIQPLNEDWAFDMFQSLNATGTPLTAIETFKPSVINATINAGKTYKDSEVESSFDKVDALFKNTTSAAQKSTLTKRFLTSFALTVEGVKLSSHFSQQRKWLTNTFPTATEGFQRQKEFISFFGDYAEFYDEVWESYDGSSRTPIPKIAAHPDAGLVSLLILYLKDSNHKMAVVILGRLYADIIRGRENSISKFVEATKAIAKFYTLWRSAHSNSGLDKCYRDFLKRPLTEDGRIDVERSNAWIDNPTIDVEALKQYLNYVIQEKGIADKETWEGRARKALKYNKAKSVCRFVLFICAHNVMKDPEHPGLMKKAKSGYADYLRLEKWLSPDLKSIEHIAPDKGINGWDSQLYTDEEWYQAIGNLTLLPGKINSSAGNRGWREKYIYYQYLSAEDMQRHQELRNMADVMGVSLSDKTVDMLKEAKFNYHAKPLVELSPESDWNLEIVKKRTDRMLDITWDFLANLV